LKSFKLKVCKDCHEEKYFRWCGNENCDAPKEEIEKAVEEQAKEDYS